MIEQVFTFKRTAALCLVGAFCSLNAQAQKITVKGSVVDGTGEPLIGATVKVKGDATSGVISDMDGSSFRLQYLLKIHPLSLPISVWNLKRLK